MEHYLAVFELFGMIMFTVFANDALKGARHDRVNWFFLAFYVALAFFFGSLFIERLGL